MTTPTPHGQVPAIQRYKIGYHADEWGVRSLSPTSIYDDAGPWVRYEDHAAVITALRTQQPAPAGATSECLTCSDHGAVGNILTAEPCPDCTRLNAQPAPATQQAPQQEAPADELEEVLRERDDAEDFINELLDEVLGADRPEWSSAYNRYDAMNDVRERITALHKPAVDKAWRRFESAMAAPQPSPAPQADSVLKDHQIAALVNELRDIAVQYHGTQQLRERIAHVVVPVLRAAPSVLEDAARLDFLIEQRAYVVSDPDACPGYWLHFVHKETGKCWVQADEHPTPRAAIDAAKAANGGNK